MFLSIRQLSTTEADLCRRTLSSRAAFALVSDAITQRTSLSIVRMGDGEVALLEAEDGRPFTRFNDRDAAWNARLGIDGLDVANIKANILKAGNECTYFAPSVSGISRRDYWLYDHFEPREVYLDNFFVNDWTKDMLDMLLRASDGVLIMHKDPEELARNFVQTYGIPQSHFAGFEKRSWRDNDAAIDAAAHSDKQLVLFSAGPAGKLIGPEIAKSGKVVIDVGNTLPGWSKGVPRS
ncbi:MAG: hypothetical protein AAB367_03075 [Patescibacteria group bacterium]